MPKSKAADKKVEKKPKEQGEEAEKIIDIDEEEETLDDDLVEGEDELGLDDEDELGLDDEEVVDPFKDRWEE